MQITCSSTTAACSSCRKALETTSMHRHHLCSSCHILQLDIPVVFSICQFSPIQLATLQLHLQKQGLVLMCSSVLEATGSSTSLLQRLTDRTWPSDSCSSFTGMPTPLEEAIPGRATPPLPLPAHQGCQPSGPAGGSASFSTAADDIIPKSKAGPQAVPTASKQKI